MSETNVALFFERAGRDPVLRGKLDEAWRQWAVTVAGLSEGTETPFTAEDLAKAWSPELDGEALDTIVGGMGGGGSDFSWVHRPYNPNGGYGGHGGY